MRTVLTLAVLVLSACVLGAGPTSQPASAPADGNARNAGLPTLDNAGLIRLARTHFKPGMTRGDAERADSNLSAALIGRTMVLTGRVSNAGADKAKGAIVEIDYEPNAPLVHAKNAPPPDAIGVRAQTRDASDGKIGIGSTAVAIGRITKATCGPFPAGFQTWSRVHAYLVLDDARFMVLVARNERDDAFYGSNK